MGVLIPSVMALRETAMTAPLDLQGEPRSANGRPYSVNRKNSTILSKNRVISEEITRFFHFKEALLLSTRVLYRKSTSWPWKSRKLSSFAELT